MSDNEIEDVSFLPGDTKAHKRSRYEPSRPQKCKQLICTQNKAVLITIVVGLVILTVAIIAAFARPALFPYCPHKPTIDAVLSSSPPEHTTPAQEAYIATNGNPFPWMDIRLPKSIIPQTYQINLHPNLTTLVFSGKVVITADVAVSTDLVIFHINDINVTTCSVSVNGKGIMISDQLEFKTNQQYALKLTEELKQGEVVVVEVWFEGWLQDKLSGFYRSEYEDKKGQKKVLASTHFEPTSAREAFPCFDEPTLKANFSLSIVREPRHTTLFNMPRNNTESSPLGGGLLVDNYQMSVKMSTYLVAFAVCEYANISDRTASGIEVRVFAPIDQISQVNFALKVAVDVLDYYEDFFGVPYPLPKQDMIAIPDFGAGAMENWGLITYRMSAIMYDSEETSVMDKQWVAIVIAHELAHQWFGNLVTMEWWNDLWLNEGFASFVEYLGVSHYSPDWNMFDQFVAMDLSRAMSLDSLTNSHPIQVPVHNPSEINQIFDFISYSKGAAIIRMLRSFLGEDVFKAGLTRYLKKYMFGNAQTDDLWNSLSEASRATPRSYEVKTIMDTWTLQMGYPVLNLRQDNNQVTVTQERFLLNPPTAGETPEFISPFGYTWYIPVSYVTADKPEESVSLWMNRSSVTFTVPSNVKWIKLNMGQVGMYRVNYDVQLWQGLIYQLNTNPEVLPTADHSGLLDDVFALAQSGGVSQKTALDLSQYLTNEFDYTPWRRALSGFDYLMGRLTETEAYEDLKAHILTLMQPVLAKVSQNNWQEQTSHLDKYLQALILFEAVDLGHAETVQQGRNLFHLWMNGTLPKLSPNLKSVIYTAGVSGGGLAEWNHCWNIYLTSQIPSEKKLMLGAMATSKDVTILARYLAYSLDKTKVRRQDAPKVLSNIAVNPAGKLLAWRFLQRNWDLISKRYGEGAFDMSGIITATASRFSTEFDYQEVTRFFADRDVGSGVRAVKQSLEAIRINIDWLNKNEEEVTTWLKHHP